MKAYTHQTKPQMLRYIWYMGLLQKVNPGKVNLTGEGLCGPEGGLATQPLGCPLIPGPDSPLSALYTAQNLLQTPEEGKFTVKHLSDS